MSQQLDELFKVMRAKPRITCMTGAGISKPSGVPTFRGEDGLWKSHRAEDLATPGAFARDPNLVWEWYNWRRKLIAECVPNAGHRVLIEWEKRYPDFTLITQNVDGLHERAGSESTVRFHGSIWLLQCWNECEASPFAWWDETTDFPELPPLCPHCRGLARPGVVWFGEGISPEVLQRSFAATDCDVFFSIGTSSVVEPAASMLAYAKQRGAYTVEINLEATPNTSLVDLFLEGSAGEQLEMIEKEIGSRT